MHYRRWDTPIRMKKTTKSRSLSRSLSSIRQTYVWRLVGLDTAADILSFRPGRKTLGFLGLTSALVSGYYWDQWKAKSITNAAIQKYANLGQEALAFEQVVRRISVLGSVQPDDSKTDRSLIWFKKHVKPILVSAGIDFTLLNGNQPGDLYRELYRKFRTRRLQSAAESLPFLESEVQPGQPYFLDLKAEANELSGGTIILGRNALKEFLFALRNAYVQDIDLSREKRLLSEKSFDELEDEELAASLASDGVFDEADASIPHAESEANSQVISTDANASRFPPMQSLIFTPREANLFSQSSLAKLEGLPPQPAILFIPFIHPVGSFMWWPKKLISYLFFESSRAAQGAEVAEILIDGTIRDFRGPNLSSEDQSHPGVWDDRKELSIEWINDKRQLNKNLFSYWQSVRTDSDLDLGIETESFYAKSFKKWPAHIEQNRYLFYSDLGKKLETARALARGERSPTQNEIDDPPPTEVELRTRRFNKEKSWCKQMDGWRIVRPGTGIAWDPSMQGALKIMVPSENGAS